MKHSHVSKIVSKIIFYLLIFAYLCFPCKASLCSENEISVYAKCIKIEDLVNNENLSLNSSELSYIYNNYEIINSSNYEINIKKITDTELQNKDMTNLNIYISTECIEKLTHQINLDKSSGYIFIVTNKLNKNINGLEDYYFIIRQSGDESKIKYVNGHSFDFSFCNSDPIILKKSININQIKKYKFFSETNEYKYIDLDVEQILYAESKNIDLFDINSEFFNDICYKFNSINNTDVTLETRNNDYYQNITLCNISLGAVYISSEYDNTTSIFTYKCAYGYFKSAAESNELIDEINNKMNKIFTSSNIKVITCYSEIFNYSNILKNYGEIICLSVFVIQLFMFFIYMCMGTKPIQKEVDKFLNPQNLNNNINSPKPDINPMPSNNIIVPLKRRSIHSKTNSVFSAAPLDISSNRDSKELANKTRKFGKKTKKKKRYTISFPPKKIDNNIIDDEDKINNIKIEDIYSNNNSFQSKESNVDEENNNDNMQNNNNNVIVNSNNINLNYNCVNIFNKRNNSKKTISTKYASKTSQISQKIDVKNNQNDDLNNTYWNDNVNNNNNFNNNFNKRKSIANLVGMINEELNILPFEEAKKYDKRSCCKYYWEIIQISHLIIFTFCHPGDYNLFIVKFGLLLFSIPLNLTIGALFYTTKEMQIVYLNKGSLVKFDLKILVRTILTSLISTIILIFLKILCFSHYSIQRLRKIENIEEAKAKSVHVIRCIKCRIFLYYLLSLIFLLAFSFYVTCFCAIYPNNQVSVLRDLIMSLILTLIYPFGLVILTSLFRRCSLRFDLSCCYCVNRLLQKI